MTIEPTEITYQPLNEELQASPRSDDFADFALQVVVSSILPFTPLLVDYFLGHGLDDLSILQACCIYLFVVGYAAKLKVVKYSTILSAVIGTSLYAFHLGANLHVNQALSARADIAPSVVNWWVCITLAATLFNVFEAWKRHVVKDSLRHRAVRND